MRIVLLNGPATSGKDTAQRLLPGYQEKLSTPLKSGVQAIFDPMRDFAPEIWEKTKDLMRMDLLEASYRTRQIELFKALAQTIGQDVLGLLLVNRLLRASSHIEAHCGGLVTISDTGRKIETLPLVKTFGIDHLLVIQIERPNTDFTKDIREWVDLSDIGVKTVRVVNDGTPEQLRDACLVHMDARWNDLQNNKSSPSTQAEPTPAASA